MCRLCGLFGAGREIHRPGLDFWGYCPMWLVLDPTYSRDNRQCMRRTCRRPCPSCWNCDRKPQRRDKRCWPNSFGKPVCRWHSNRCSLPLSRPQLLLPAGTRRHLDYIGRRCQKEVWRQGGQWHRANRQPLEWRNSYRQSTSRLWLWPRWCMSCTSSHFDESIGRPGR